MSKAKRLVEEVDKYINEEELTKDRFAKQVSDIVNNEFTPIYNKLWQMCKDFKEANPSLDVYNISPQLDRDLDFFAQATGILKDILDGKSREKGLEKKIRKVLGYNG